MRASSQPLLALTYLLVDGCCALPRTSGRIVPDCNYKPGHHGDLTNYKGAGVPVSS